MNPRDKVLPVSIKSQISPVNSRNTLFSSLVDSANHTKTILIAEDDPTSRKLLFSHVLAMKQSIYVVANGNEVVAAYKRNHASICIILMDENMPLTHGLDATQQIRKFEDENNLSRVRIVIVSGDSELTKDSVIAHGADNLITKPVQMKDLDSELKTTLLGSQRAVSHHALENKPQPSAFKL